MPPPLISTVHTSSLPQTGTAGILRLPLVSPISTAHICAERVACVRVEEDTRAVQRGSGLAFR